MGLFRPVFLLFSLAGCFHGISGGWTSGPPLAAIEKRIFPAVPGVAPRLLPAVGVRAAGQPQLPPMGVAASCTSRIIIRQDWDWGKGFFLWNRWRDPVLGAKGRRRAAPSGSAAGAKPS
jgi:hypothetical protein